MPPSPVVAVVPLRSPGAGKTRLAPHLTAAERAALSGAMLADVCATLSRSGVDRIVVAAGGPAAAAAAGALDVDVLLDPPHVRGLNAALETALSRLRTAGTRMIVTADLPWLTAAHVGALIAVSADVVVAPTRDGGTGGLVLRNAATRLRLQYGRSSAEAHRRAAVRAGLTVCRADLDGFRKDVDTWDDIRYAQALPPDGHTHAVVMRLLRGRLSSGPRPQDRPGDLDAAGHRQDL